MCNLVFDPTQLNREYLTEKQAFTTRPSCPHKNIGLFLPNRIAGVILTPVSQPMDLLCEDKMCDLVSAPRKLT